MKNSILLLLTLIALMITINSCIKGDTGPAGRDGNANVLSQQFTVTWTQSPPDYYCDIFDSDITQAIVDYGSVEVFMSNGSGGWIALPCTLPITSTYSSTYTPVHYLNGVTIWKTDTDLAQTADPGSKTFKVVCISANLLKAWPKVDWKNYEEVKKILKLAD